MAAHGLAWTALGAAALAISALGPAPVTMRYRIDQSLSQETDASAAGQGRLSLAFTTSTFVTATLNDSAGGRTLRVLVDSMQGDSATPIPPAVLDSARGAVFHGFLSPEGRPSQLRSEAGPVAAQIQGLVSDFYPWSRAGLMPGDTWTDTSVVTTGEAPETVTVRRITRYRAAVAGAASPRRAVRVTTDFTSEVSGSQATPSGPAKIAGGGGGKGSYLVSPDGRFLGGEWQLSSSLTLSGGFAPAPVPITLRQTTRVATLQ